MGFSRSKLIEHSSPFINGEDIITLHGVTYLFEQNFRYSAPKFVNRGTSPYEMIELDLHRLTEVWTIVFTK